MKNYLRAIQEYENSNNSLSLLYGFLSTTDSDLINLYCSGKLHLPSFMLLKQVSAKFLDLINEDKELKILFNNTIKCSKLFYSHTVTNINLANSQNKNFEHLFSKNSQPLGQRLISLLLNIKYRIRVARIKRQKSLARQGLQKTFSMFSKITSQIFYLFNDFAYQARLLQSTHSNLSRKIYYFSVATTIAGFWFVNTSLSMYLSPLSIALINCAFCALITALATLAYPVYDFELIDIDGKNVIAYKYQAFFNSLSNKKLYKIFALQYDNDSRQTEDMGIESAY
jgi:hypothetical protein